ncbi:MAG: hypothetical protein Q9220_005437 [cf. Caloplaca sp. 1 TL-2023]
MSDQADGSLSSQKQVMELSSPARLARVQQFEELQKLPIYRMPAELLSNILDRVDLVNFPSLMIAMYHLLRVKGFIPAYPTEMVKMLLLREEDGNTESTSLSNMPKELLLAIGQTLTTYEKIHMVLATHRMRPEDIELITHESPA